MRTPDDLERYLSRHGVTAPEPLCRALGISRATLSRRVNRGDSRVLRLGGGPQVRYAMSRDIISLPRDPLPVYRVDAQGAAHDLGRICPLEPAGTWWEHDPSGQRLYEGLPPVFLDMRPEGFLGRMLALRAGPELGLPDLITRWNDDHILSFLARRGEELPGDLVLGRQSRHRLLDRSKGTDYRESDLPGLAERALAGEPAGSSAGGEQPKFAVSLDGRHCLVKFCRLDDTPAARRQADLLRAEHIVGRVLPGEPGCARSRLVDRGGYRHLVVERFDRIGRHGRRGIVSLAAIDDEYLGRRASWTDAARHLARERMIDGADAARLAWLEIFAALIANTDRHFGNISFFTDHAGGLVPTPVYDMLPMALSPDSQGRPRDRLPELLPPRDSEPAVWQDATRAATAFWETCAGDPGFGDDFRGIAGEAVTRLAEQNH